MGCSIGLMRSYKELKKSVQFSSVQFSRSVVSNSLPPHESQHTRPPCPSPTPGVHSDSRPLSQWCQSGHLILCHPLLLPLIPPSIRVFFNEYSQWKFVEKEIRRNLEINRLFTWGGQSTEVSASASFPPKKSQGWSTSDWTGWISLQSKGLSRVFSNTTVQKHQL